MSVGKNMAFAKMNSSGLEIISPRRDGS